MKQFSCLRAWALGTNEPFASFYFRNIIQAQARKLFSQTSGWWKTRSMRPLVLLTNIFWIFLCGCPKTDIINHIYIYNYHWLCSFLWGFQTSSLTHHFKAASSRRQMDSFEIALNFSDSVHQGDRRKKSQQWHLGSNYVKDYNIFFGHRKDNLFEIE